MSSSSGKVFWEVGKEIPEELKGCADPFSSALVPRMVAWFTVDNERVSLLEGYNGASYTPPSLFFSSLAIPGDFLTTLKQNKVCTISLATTREAPESFQKASRPWSEGPPEAFAFDDLGLQPATTKKTGYPAAIATSPIHMHCSLENYVNLVEKTSDDDDDDGEEEAMIVLLVESFVMDGSILSPPTEAMKKRPNVTAKIDVQLIQPVVSLGHGRICPLKSIRSMPRPVKQQQQQQDTTTTTTGTTTTSEETWTSTDFTVLAEPTPGPGGFETTEWNFREHGGTSPLGYNAITALVLPRPIGWISTYHKSTSDNSDDTLSSNQANQRVVAHLAPYSFFANVTRSQRHPMVAFSGFRRDNGASPKDAQNNAEQTGCYVYNMVTESLAEAMNLSAAELPRDESEFALAGLNAQQRATLVDAPIVQESPIRLECQYVKSVPVGSFSLVVGRVVGIAFDKNILTSNDSDNDNNNNNGVNIAKLKAITRLGFMDEYGTLNV